MVLYTFDDVLLNDFFEWCVSLIVMSFCFFSDNVRTIDPFGISLSKIRKSWEFAFHQFQSLWWQKMGSRDRSEFRLPVATARRNIRWCRGWKRTKKRNYPPGLLTPKRDISSSPTIHFQGDFTCTVGFKEGTVSQSPLESTPFSQLSSWSVRDLRCP